MSKLTWAQLSEIDVRLGALDMLWGDAVLSTTPTKGADISEAHQWKLLDRLNRLVVAVTKALPGAEGRMRIGGQSR